MRKISTWASTHRNPARCVIVLLKILLLGIAVWTGHSFAAIGITIPDYISVLGCMMLCIAAVSYPSRKQNRKTDKHFYLCHKTCDFIITISTFVLLVSAVNNQLYPRVTVATYASNSLALSIDPTAGQIIASLKYRDKTSLTKWEKKILKKEFKRQAGIYGKALITGNKSDAEQALLIILVIIAALGITFLLAGLVCSISCSGAEGLAAVIAILGLIGIIWGTVAVIRTIRRGRSKRNRNWAKVNPSNY